MSKRKKLATGVAAILPLTGVAILGAARSASATAPVAAVVCTNLQPQQSGSAIVATSSALGGTSFDNAEGTTPGSNGVYLGVNPGTATSHSTVTLLKQVNKNGTSAEFTAKVGSAEGRRRPDVQGRGVVHDLHGPERFDAAGEGHSRHRDVHSAVGPRGHGHLHQGRRGGDHQRHVGDRHATTWSTPELRRTTRIELVGGFNSGDIGQEVNVSYNPGSGVWANALGFTASQPPTAPVAPCPVAPRRPACSTTTRSSS